MTHTPTPWTAECHHMPNGNPFGTISTADGKDIAYLTLRPDEVFDNTRLIVRAVNAHADLLAALERAEGELIYAAEKLPHSNARDALNVVRAAIAKARES